MRVFNEDKTQELDIRDCDLTNGILIGDKLVVGHRKSYIETIKNKDGSVTTIKHDTLDILEDILVYKLKSDLEKYREELNSLNRWFETEYRETYEKCKRKIDLGIKMHDGSDPKVVLGNLYEQAETTSVRINELKELIENGGDNGSSNN